MSTMSTARSWGNAWGACVWWLGGAAAVAALSWRASSTILLPLAGLAFAITLLVVANYPELSMLLYFIPGKIGFEERLELHWGISANQIFQALFALVLLLALARRPQRPCFPRITLGFTAGLCALMLVGLAYTDNVAYGAFKALSYALLVVPCVVFLGLHVDRPLLLRRFLLFFAGIALGMMLLGLRNLGTLEQGHRLAVFGGGANVYSRMLGSGLLLLLMFAVMLRRSGHAASAWVLAMLLGPGFLVTMYFAGSKGPMLALLLSALFFAALHGRLRRTLFIVLVVGVGFVAARQGSRSFDDAVEMVSVSRLFLNPKAEISYGSYGSRVDFYKYSAERLSEQPLVGVGTGAWGSRRTLFEDYSYPHNLFVELACELGLVGLAVIGAYCGWLALQTRRLLQRMRQSEHYVVITGLCACLLFWFLNVQVSGDVVDNRNLWIFAALTEVAARFSGHQAAEGES